MGIWLPKELQKKISNDVDGVSSAITTANCTNTVLGLG
jgi:hypothetical protein